MSTTQAAVTAEEMHAAIAERIEGWRWIHRECLSYSWFASPEDVAEFTADEQLRGVIGDGGKPREGCAPNYSADLNLVARAEARVAEMGPVAMARYGNALGRELSGDTSQLFRYITAPAQARVKALYAVALLIGEAKP